ncbi:hypothetical protein ACFQE1_04300, partial [Halobium palmae]
ERAVRELARERDAPAYVALTEDLGVTAEGGQWARALVRWVEDDDPDDELREYLTGTPGQDVGLGFDDLAESVLPLLDAVAERPTLRLNFDGPAWIDADRDTGRTALDLVEDLGRVVDVRLGLSPRTRTHLVQTYPEFGDEHLTESGDATRHSRSAEERDGWDAWDVLGGWSPQGGRVRLLANIPAGEGRAVSALKDDLEVDLSAGSVDRYLREFEAEHEFVDVDRRRTSNRVSLNAYGQAAQALISPDYRAQHPAQMELSDDLTRPSHQHPQVQCNSQDGSRGGCPRAPTAEEWVAATGTPSGSAGYVRWLNGEAVDAYRLHRRYQAGKRVDGVTCVDAPIEEFDDGRVAYVSAFEDDLQVLAQWGGPAATLVRVAHALSSEPIWGKVLTREVVGDNLEEIHEAIAEPQLLATLQAGDQLGWLSRDEMEYYAFRDRLHGVAKSLLGDLGRLPDLDPEQRGAVFRRAHGLLATMTKLLDAVGLDVTIHVRTPDTTRLRSDEKRYAGFLEFFRRTVPKQTAYGVHSAYRQRIETREEKLKARLPIELDPEDHTADMTASWVVAGPNADTFVDDISASIGELEEREAVRTGAEEAPRIEIPVVAGGTYAAIKRIVDDVAREKGWIPDAEQLDRLTRILMGVTGTGKWRASPFDAADVMHALGRSNGSRLDASDLAYGISQLPHDRIFPDLAPTAQKMVKALLAAEEPLTPSELQAEAGVSEGSYKRHAPTLETVGVIERSEGQWQAFIEPWWAPDSPRSRPIGESIPEQGVWADEFLVELAFRIDGADDGHEVFWRGATLEEIGEAVPELRPWIELVRVAFRDPPDEVADGRYVRFGAEPDTAQTRLPGSNPGGTAT